MNEIELKRIGNYIELLTDYHANGSYKTLKNNVTLKSEKDYAIMIRTLNFERNDFKDDLIYVDENAYNHLSKSKVFQDDILINKIANPGSIYIMPNIEQPVTCGMNLFLIRFCSKVNQRYMYYCMKNYEKFIKRLSHGTTTKTITKDDIQNLILPIHTDIQEQNQIEQLLTLIDKKIENNEKITTNLKIISHQIYMHYFFGKTNNSNINKIIKENTKSTVQVNDAKKTTGNYPFFTSGDSILEYDHPFVSGRNLYLNTGGNADVKFYVGDAAYSTDTWCISAKNDLEDYLFFFLDSIKFELNIKFFQGTGLKHLQKPMLKDREIYYPTNDELKEFNSQVRPMMNTISKKITENKSLAILRDTLIPMLMSGQITITD